MAIIASNCRAYVKDPKSGDYEFIGDVGNVSVNQHNDVMDKLEFTAACSYYKRFKGRLPGSNRTSRLRKKRRDKVVKLWISREWLRPIWRQLMSFPFEYHDDVSDVLKSE